MQNETACKVLLVEDDAGICKFLKTTLTANGYEVLVTTTGRQALEVISSHCPECILLDLGLPDMDGIRVIESVRSWTRTPIIVLSARSAEEDKAVLTFPELNHPLFALINEINSRCIVAYDNIL